MRGLVSGLSEGNSRVLRLAGCGARRYAASDLSGKDLLVAIR